MAALREQLGTATADRWLQETGHADLVAAPPEVMVPESEFIRLTHDLYAGHGAALAGLVLARSGTRTGEYLLAHRIPAAARWLLPRLPARLALRVLTRAIGAHAWTFAGSGAFRVEWGSAPVFSIAGCPGCRGRRSPFPDCAYYRATFERLLRALIDPGVTVTEESCEAAGAAACRFRIDFPS
ncbi:MAG: bacteriochlorophyll 4-vinyl reductase [Gemmatimonadales bacterium]|nr:bacteriochlorophyll 4-vinyl reductase [Gemmatimonadales bacterium]MBP9200039.1 bacteriochlorophyll 4-vinyl reductase [Gemmatimonadales bacterium]